MSPITPLDIESHSIAMMHQWIDIWSPQDFRLSFSKLLMVATSRNFVEDYACNFNACFQLKSPQHQRHWLLKHLPVPYSL